MHLNSADGNDFLFNVGKIGGSLSQQTKVPCGTVSLPSPEGKQRRPFEGKFIPVTTAPIEYKDLSTAYLPNTR